MLEADKIWLRSWGYRHRLSRLLCQEWHLQPFHRRLVSQEAMQWFALKGALAPIAGRLEHLHRRLRRVELKDPNLPRNPLPRRASE